MVLSGPLHGSAAIACHRMLLDAATSTPEQAVARALSGGALRGFGHPVYRGEDLRSVHLRGKLADLVGVKERELVDRLAVAGTAASGAPPNVDFALAAMAFAMKMPAFATEAVFALGRAAGWVAHALEEYEEEPLRFRARAIYVGANGDDAP